MCWATILNSLLTTKYYTSEDTRGWHNLSLIILNFIFATGSGSIDDNSKLWHDYYNCILYLNILCNA